MLRSKIKWLVPVALTLLSFWSGVESANAQKIYNFTVVYDTSVKINPFKPNLPDIVRATITGEATDAPYGLSSFTSNTYGKVINDPNTSITTTIFNSDPAVLGLQGEQAFSDTYGSENQLFGKASDSAQVNPAAGTIQGGGTITIYGGTGIFENARGIITFTESDTLNSDPTAPSKGQAKLRFFFEVPDKVVGSSKSRHQYPNP
ncbi:hypothetical protein G7B40_016390 [Aetokthonos hydrillicola Thurmond2011]|jgi:hypothetical protein|uniref:Dirigent protein n=2 Tax=Aetokthonos TaxID=1550243 RepID=A0AAP5I7H2_9CYAN|nr:hypothetical protein [Aetokthonos hydrillicola]MBO3458760.1 hypothetical protein [Aetokthonos hydrillicola CCALA 1050]MBW4585508.1 hypothetical protein [Aetokthonos hydrillicola CCALA 1050]MDR9896129.1 hypothetical protein [Aetokthonos hydrillicola Thurmond2011]